MVSAEREPIMGVWGLCPQRGPGWGVRGAKPPEAGNFSCFLEFERSNILTTNLLSLPLL